MDMDSAVGMKWWFSSYLKPNGRKSQEANVQNRRRWSYCGRSWGKINWRKRVNNIFGGTFDDGTRHFLFRAAGAEWRVAVLSNLWPWHHSSPSHPSTGHLGCLLSLASCCILPLPLICQTGLLEQHVRPWLHILLISLDVGIQFSLQTQMETLVLLPVVHWPVALPCPPDPGHLWTPVPASHKWQATHANLNLGIARNLLPGSELSVLQAHFHSVPNPCLSHLTSLLTWHCTCSSTSLTWVTSTNVHSVHLGPLEPFAWPAPIPAPLPEMTLSPSHFRTFHWHLRSQHEPARKILLQRRAFQFS